MTNNAPIGIPFGRHEWRPDEGRDFVVITAHCADGKEPIVVEMTADQWRGLPLVQYVVKLLLSRQQPRRPTHVSDDQTGPAPHGHIEWSEGQNWVILTSYRAGSRELATVKMTLAQWFALGPVRHAVQFRLERWQEHKEYFRPRPWTTRDH